MSERLIEIARQPDGRFLANFADGEPAVEVTSWHDIRDLRGRRHMVDHWSDADLQTFIEQHGHPFDDWWTELTPACAEALAADPKGPVPPQHHEEVKRTLRHHPKQTGLGLDGSRFSSQVQAYLAQKAEREP